MSAVLDLTEIRAREPHRIADGWAARTRRPLLGTDGRLLLVAADHPARGALGVRSDGMAMASRPALLERLATALSRPGVDGVLGTPDILDDLLLMGVLEGKLVIGSMNRGGLQGATFELDDRFTAYRADEIAARRLDGGKMLTRICLGDPGTVVAMTVAAGIADTSGRTMPCCQWLASTPISTVGGPDESCGTSSTRASASARMPCGLWAPSSSTFG